MHLRERALQLFLVRRVLNRLYFKVASRINISTSQNFCHRESPSKELAGRTFKVDRETVAVNQTCEAETRGLLVGPTDFLVGTPISSCLYCSGKRRPDSVLAACQYRDVLCNARSRRDRISKRHAD